MYLQELIETYVYDNEDNKKEFKRFVSIMKNVSIQFIYG